MVLSLSDILLVHPGVEFSSLYYMALKGRKEDVESLRCVSVAEWELLCVSKGVKMAKMRGSSCSNDANICKDVT